MTKPFIDQEDEFNYDKDFFDEFFTEEDESAAPVEKTKTEPKEEQKEIPVTEPEEEPEKIPVAEPKEEPEKIPAIEPVERPKKDSVEKAKKPPKKQYTEKNINVPIPFAKKRHRGLAISLAAILLCLVAFIGVVFYQEYVPYASVYMSINPTVRIDVNKKDIVINVEGVNPDGEVMIKDYNYQKKDIEKVVDELIDRAIEMEYLTEGGTIKLTLDSSHAEWIQKHKDSLNQLINSHLTGMSESMNIQIEMEEIDSSATTESGLLNRNNSDEEERENNNSSNSGNNDTTSNDDRDDNTTADNTTNNTTADRTEQDNTASDNTTENDTTENDTTEDDTTEDDTTEDDTTEDDTTEDDTSSDVTEEDNTTADSTEKDDTTTEEPKEDDTTADNNTDSDMNVGNGEMVINPNSVEDADDSLDETTAEERMED